MSNEQLLDEYEAALSEMEWTDDSRRVQDKIDRLRDEVLRRMGGCS